MPHRKNIGSLPTQATLRRTTLAHVARELRLAIVCIEALRRSEAKLPGMPSVLDGFDVAHATRTLWLIERELQRARKPRPMPAAPATATATATAARGPRRQPVSPAKAIVLPETPGMSAVFRRRLAGALAALSRAPQA